MLGIRRAFCRLFGLGGKAGGSDRGRGEYSLVELGTVGVGRDEELVGLVGVVGCGRGRGALVSVCAWFGAPDLVALVAAVPSMGHATVTILVTADAIGEIVVAVAAAKRGVVVGLLARLHASLELSSHL
jgi:hypothetical protein